MHYSLEVVTEAARGQLRPHRWPLLHSHAKRPPPARRDATLYIYIEVFAGF